MTEIIRADVEDQLELIEQAYPQDNRYQVKKFTNFIRQAGMGVTPDSLGAYVDYLDQLNKEGKCSANSHSTYISAACSALTSIADHLDLTDSERLAFERTKKAANKRKKKPSTKAVDPEEIPSIEELKLLVSSTKDKTVSLLVDFLMHTGARISEALNIRLSDITQKHSYALITLRGKRSKERQVRVEKALIRRIKDHFLGETWLFEHSGRQYSRVSVSQRIKIEGLRYTGKEFTAHSIRHSFLTNALVKTGRIKAVQELAGHSSASTTIDKYVHDSFSWAEQKALLD